MLTIRINKLIALLLLVAAMGTQYACKKSTSEAAPVITGLRASSPAPYDSSLTMAGPGQVVVIQGSGLAAAKQILFNGYSATFNSALFANNTIIVQIPANMPFASLDPKQLNTVKVITPYGQAVYTFPIIPSAATITGMSNENALAGDRVTIYGSSFFFVEKVVFPGGIEVTTNLSANNTGNELQVTVPAGITKSGPIMVKTIYGSTTSILLFNDLVTGVLHNSDNVSNFSWGCDVVSDPSLFPGGHGTYNRMTFSGVNGGDGAWWSGGRSLNTNGAQWVPSANLADPLASYALKFEIYLKQPWSAGKFFIVKDYNWTCLALYSPWLNADGSTTAYTTNGWRTVTIPLTEFRTKKDNNDGTGDSAPSLKTLVGDNGAGGLDIMFINNGTAAVENFDAAIDNVRIVKIQ
jgi:hypothetical protein